MRKEEIACYKHYSFSYNVFHSYISLAHQNAVLCGSGLTDRYHSFYKRLKSSFQPLLNKILALSTLKATKKKKINEVQIEKFFFAFHGYQYFLFFATIFYKALRVIKSGYFVEKC